MGAPSVTAAAVVRTVAGPWGPLHLAATSRGIVAAQSAIAVEAFIAGLARRLGGEVCAEGDAADVGSAGGDAAGDARRALLDRASVAIDAFLAGRPFPSDVVPVPVDLADRARWDRVVLMAVRDVPWGQTASYGEIARRIGSPRAARAVGGALGRNPVTFLIPCHRIIASDGSIGGYGGYAWELRQDALDRKRQLLMREGITLADAGG